MTHAFERDPKYSFCRHCGYPERDLLMHPVHVEPPPQRVMSDFERRLANRFREHGDRLLSSQRAWTKTGIDVGTEPLRIAYKRLPGHGSPRGAYRYELRLDAAGLVRVQDLLGIETIGPYILVDARILDERASDGPVLAVTTLRLWYGKIERGSALMMRSPGGMWISCRWATVGKAEKACIAAIRKKLRRWIADYEDQGFAPGAMVRDPESTWEHGRDPTHVIFDMFGIALFLCDGLDAGIEVRRAADGKWIASDTGRMGFFEEEYAAGKVVAVVEAPDPDDAYLEGALG